MRKRLIFLTILVITMFLVVTPVMAGGDKNRGTVGVGDVEQHQVSWVAYESRLLTQEQVLTQTQVQTMARMRHRYSHSPLADLWY